MPELQPASASPLMATTLPVTPKARGSSTNAAPSLDDKVEYLDGFGVPRRSQTYTYRTVLRGYAVEMPDALIEEIEQKRKADEEKRKVEEEQAKAEREREKSTAAETTQSPRKKSIELSPEALRKANAEFKAKCKEERLQWITEADQHIVDRLTRWYDGSTVPVDADYVDITEMNTVVSPSKKTQAFIDGDGNLRRKSAPQVVITIEDATDKNAKAKDAMAAGGEEVRPADTAAPLAPVGPTVITVPS